MGGGLMNFRFGTYDAYIGRVPLKLELQPPQKRDQAAIDAARLVRRRERARKRVLARIRQRGAEDGN